MGKKPTPEQVEWQKGARERLVLVLERLYDGNQSRLARALGVTQALVNIVVRKVQAPTRNLITRLGRIERVNPLWAETGEGEPFLPDTRGTLPVATAVLPGPPLLHPNLHTGARHPVAPAFDKPTRYWLALLATSPLLREPALRFALGDLLLLETDEEWTRRPDMTDGRLCGVRIVVEPKPSVGGGTVTRFASDLEPSYCMGIVTSSSRGATVMLRGGSVGPSPLGSTTQRKTMQGNVKRQVGDRERLADKRKASKGEQDVDVILRAGGEVLLIQQKDIQQKDVLAVAVYLARAEPHIVPSGG